MITFILIVTAVFLIGLGCGVVAWFLFRYRQVVKSRESSQESGESLTFRWNYIILPLVILFLSIVIITYFYHQLPAEVAYHFQPDGSPDKWFSREMTIPLMLAPQFLLTLLAGGITWGITKLGILFRQPGSTGLKPETIISFMGNIIAMPQIILCFAMLNIFSYNAYQTQLMSIWVFALIIMVVGGIIIGIFFIQTIRRAWAINQALAPPNNDSKERQQ